MFNHRIAGCQATPVSSCVYMCLYALRKATKPCNNSDKPAVITNILLFNCCYVHQYNIRAGSKKVEMLWYNRSAVLKVPRYICTDC